MSFYKTDSNNEIIRNRVEYVQPEDEKIIVEQHHKDEVNINNIIKRHGMDMIAKTAMLNQGEYIMDDNPTNDFQEAMFIVTKANETFSQMPSELRKKFNNSPAEYMDFIQNPANIDEMVSLGLAQRTPEAPVVKVEVTNQQTAETPPDTGAVV